MKRSRYVLTFAAALTVLTMAPVTAAPNTPSPSPTPTPSASAEPEKPITAFEVPLPLLQQFNDLAQDRTAADEAQAAADSAWVAADAMQGPAFRAAEYADAAQVELDAYARNSYMMGSPTESQLIIESDGDDISDVIQGVAYRQHVGSAKAVDTAIAIQTARTIQSTYQSLLGAAYAASTDAYAAQQKEQATTDATLAMAEGLGPEYVAITLPITSQDGEGCPTQVAPEAVIGLGPDFDINAACHSALDQAKTDEAKGAISWAFTRLGSPYACKGIGRENMFQFDCSSYMVAAYTNGAGIDTRYNGWSPTTHTMLGSHPNFQPIATEDLSAGDLALYYTCPEGETCTYNHVVMYLGEYQGQPLMLHTNRCGGVANVTPFWGTAEKTPHGRFLGLRRVVTADPNAPVPVFDEFGFDAAA